MLNKGYVYVIGNREQGLYKIGSSRIDPLYRLEQIQPHCPFELEMIEFSLVKNAKRIEQRLHEFFEYDRLRINSKFTDWFKLTADKVKKIGAGIPKDEVIDDPTLQLKAEPTSTPPEPYCKASEFQEGSGLLIST
jgi:hypothetical protein